VVYRPLYKEASVFKAGKLFDIRPLDMFLSDAPSPTKDGQTRPRFAKISDPQIIAALEKIKRDMYE